MAKFDNHVVTSLEFIDKLGPILRFDPSLVYAVEIEISHGDPVQFTLHRWLGSAEAEQVYKLLGDVDGKTTNGE